MGKSSTVFIAERAKLIVTIILPVFNEEFYIARCLEAILNQDYPRDRMEIVIADGMSTDGTRQAIAKVANDHGVPLCADRSEDFKSDGLTITLLDNPQRIVSTGLNRALRIASGDIVVRVDGHCEISPDYVSRCVQYLDDDQVAGVGGYIETIGETKIAKAIAVGMSTPFGVGGSAFRTRRDKTIFVDSVPFPAYRWPTIAKAGFFDEELVRNQDDEYNYRIRKLGGKILLAQDIRSKYYSRSTLTSLFRQYFQYGFWKVRVFQKHPRQMSFRQFIPPVFVLSLVLAGITGYASQFWRALFALDLGLYLLINLGASLWVGSKFGWEISPFMPLVYLSLHLSYGAGFLFGLIRFITRWGDKVGKTPPDKMEAFSPGLISE